MPLGWMASGAWCRCAWQPEVQSKVDVLGGPTVTTAVSAVQADHRLNLAKSREADRENGYENRSPVFIYDDPLNTIYVLLQISQGYYCQKLLIAKIKRL